MDPVNQSDCCSDYHNLFKDNTAIALIHHQSLSYPGISFSSAGVMDTFSKTLSSLKRSKILTTLILSAVIAALIMFVLWFALNGLFIFKADFQNTALNWIFKVLSPILTGYLAWFLLPPFIFIVVGFFQERIIRVVQKNEYLDPNFLQFKAKLPSLWTEILQGFKLASMALSLNLLILPSYLFGIGIFISIIINAYLFGKEFFYIICSYFLSNQQAKKIYQKNFIPILITGLVLALLSLVPILNFFVPIIGVIWMLHLFQAIHGKIELN